MWWFITSQANLRITHRQLAIEWVADPILCVVFSLDWGPCSSLRRLRCLVGWRPTKCRFQTTAQMLSIFKQLRYKCGDENCLPPVKGTISLLFITLSICAFITLEISCTDMLSYLVHINCSAASRCIARKKVGDFDFRWKIGHEFY